MNDPFNQFHGLTFDRTQPREWRNTPFAGDAKIAPIVLKTIGIALLWVALLCLSLWSISNSAPLTQQHMEKRK